MYYVTLIYLCIFKHVYGSIYMYRIIYMQVHVEIELYSLFVLFSFFLCSNILYPYLFIIIILKIIRYTLSISTKYSNT